MLTTESSVPSRQGQYGTTTQSLPCLQDSETSNDLLEWQGFYCRSIHICLPAILPHAREIKAVLPSRRTANISTATNKHVISTCEHAFSSARSRLNFSQYVEYIPRPKRSHGCRTFVQYWCCTKLHAINTRTHTSPVLTTHPGEDASIRNHRS